MFTSTAPEPLLFCRCALVGLDVYSIHQGHDSGHAWLMVFGATSKDLGPTFGVQPVAIDAQFAYVVRSAYVYDEIDLRTGESRSLASPVPGSSQGISDVRPDGEIWWADLHRTLTVQGLTLTYPNVRGDVTLGQADPTQIAGVSPAWFTAFAGDGFEPHLAVNGTRYALCARTPQGAAYLEVPPFPPYLGPVDHVPGPVVNEAPKEPAMPKPQPPSFDQWIKHDYPKVRAAYVATQGHAPDDEWAAFQTQRYFAFWIGLGEYWPIARMLAEEAHPGSTKQQNYPEPSQSPQ